MYVAALYMSAALLRHEVPPMPADGAVEFCDRAQTWGVYVVADAVVVGCTGLRVELSFEKAHALFDDRCDSICAPSVDGRE